MGVPKFFRFLSERYPLISQLIQEGSIPEFDNLYLDMNGVIHNCSHANNDDVHYRITEEQIFVAVFAYIEHLFSKIKPRKLFFMAVDGVAPRAKMNQQRSRRFRTAKEAKDLRDKALAKGETLPEEAPFDSNCITPGTPFMVRLHEQLKYFIVKKVNEDANWRDIDVILSGHDVPGEGEHKIMEYIRLAKAQPDYNPNLRHCLYGLDADLIMLGLLSHDPHFCLLREEVTFGPQRKKARSSLETQNFYLMHLSLVREYLDLEFSTLAATHDLGFEYDLERIIDDWILLVIFVGNDFLPHLPGIHIAEGALNVLYQIYKRILPKAGGYLNEHGKLNVKRLQLVLNELASFEQDLFEQEYADSNWYRGKQQKHIEAMEQARARAKLQLTQVQRQLFDQIKSFVLGLADHQNSSDKLAFPAIYPARDRRFLSDIADQLRLSISFDEYDNDEPVIVLRLDEEVAGMMHAETQSNFSGDDNDGEWRNAIERVLLKYEKAPVLVDQSESDFEDEYAIKLKEKMDAWKVEYYKDKMGINYNNADEMHQLAFRYVQGLQWVLHYYYDGVAAWGWFYDYHYAPKITDLIGVDKFEFNFDLGTPFKPFEQLMGVLPDLSNQFIPKAFRDLMTDPASPIIDFYPRNFEADLNGKKQDWEAVVKIPFIEEKRLLSAMQTRAPLLTAEEKSRNTWGPSWRCRYNANHDETYGSSLPGFFPDLVHVHSVLEQYPLPTLDGLRLVKGLCEGVLLGKDVVAGFPSLQTLNFTGQLGFQSVNVFMSDSRNESMVITIDNAYEGLKVEEIARKLVGKRIFANWPHLKESLVVAVSDDLFRYELDLSAGRADVTSVPHRPDEMLGRRRVAERLEHVYAKRFATVVGSVDILLHVKPIKGMKLMEDGALVKEFDDKETEQPLQTTVESVASLDLRFQEQSAQPIEEAFPKGQKVFFLGAKPSYGCAAQVIGHASGNLQIVTAFFPTESAEHVHYGNYLRSQASTAYQPSFQVGRRLRMNGLTLSRITSSLMIFGPDDTKVNAGLQLKFEAKSLKVLGYSRKGETGWEFSAKAVALIEEYKAAFPEIIFVLEQSHGSDIKSIERFYPNDNPATKIKEIKAWIKAKGIDDLEKVPLDSESLDAATVKGLEDLADRFSSEKRPDLLKKAVITSIPRRAVLKPEQAKSKLQHQSFEPGDRVVMVEESGNVPLSAKGTCVGLQPGLLDVLWDVPFIGGTTLQGRCTQYRGMSVSPDSVLNLGRPQLVSTFNQASIAQPSNNNLAIRGGRGRGNNNRGFFTPAADRGNNSRGRTFATNGRDSTHNYRAAAQNDPSAYAAQRQAGNQQQRLQDAINSGAPPPRGPRKDYSNVPPPASINNGPSRGRGFARGSPANRILRSAQGSSPRGNGRGRGVNGNSRPEAVAS